MAIDLNEKMEGVIFQLIKKTKSDLDDIKRLLGDNRQLEDPKLYEAMDKLETVAQNYKNGLKALNSINTILTE